MRRSTLPRVPAKPAGKSVRKDYTPHPLVRLRTAVYSGWMEALLKRITFNPKQCGGRPCVRGMRIRVGDVLDLLAAGLSMEQIVQEMPDLEVDDIKACLAFARRRINHPSIAA